MDEFLPETMRDAIHAARTAKLKAKSRLRVLSDGQTYPVLRSWDRGFALDASDTPHLRGLVDLYDGTRHLIHCLIVASSEEAGEMRYEFKRRTRANTTPPLDYIRPDTAPVALIER